ncbi:MAG: hypothetical protein H7288_18655 [Kineosporiaceae bacterium]|nr:hypothetical protein [Aeromicrobium sp.]
MSEMSGDEIPGAEQTDAVLSGNGRIDVAMARLERLDEVPVDAHPPIFDEIHARLRDALANAGRDEDPSTSS